MAEDLTSIIEIINGNHAPPQPFMVVNRYGFHVVVILPDQVLEVRSVQGTLRITRKVRERDEQDLPKTLADDAGVVADPLAIERSAICTTPQCILH